MNGDVNGTMEEPMETLSPSAEGDNMQSLKPTTEANIAESQPDCNIAENKPSLDITENPPSPGITENPPSPGITENPPSPDIQACPDTVEDKQNSDTTNNQLSPDITLNQPSPDQMDAEDDQNISENDKDIIAKQPNLDITDNQPSPDITENKASLANIENSETTCGNGDTSEDINLENGNLDPLNNKTENSNHESSNEKSENIEDNTVKGDNSTESKPSSQDNSSETVLTESQKEAEKKENDRLDLYMKAAKIKSSTSLKQALESNTELERERVFVFESDDADSLDEDSENGDKVADTVSINSDDDEDDDAQDNSDIVLVEDCKTQNGSEVHEIMSDDNDDCIVTNEETSNSSLSNGKNATLRRNRRASKRKNYDDSEDNDDESDVEVVPMEDPLNQDNSMPNAKRSTRSLMSAKKAKTNNNNQKDSVVIVDTISILDDKEKKSSAVKNVSLNAQNLCQSIAARGTTVTAVSVKAAPSSQSSQTASPPAPVLPSLTDDMFVVEAPSFIVPYVYEKPSIKPFREFVDILGKELEDQKAKEELERLEKEKLKKEAKDKDRKERKERGEEVSESEDEEKKKKREANRARRRKQRTEEDDDSWNGSNSSESEDDILSDEEGKIKDDDSIEEVKEIMPGASHTGKPDSYFNCSLGKFFMDIGQNLVQEFVQIDLLKQQTRKLNREKKGGHSTRATETSLASLRKNIELSKESNEPFTFNQVKCEFCTFKSESMLTMANHLEVPHMKNNLYRCNFCPFEIKSPHDILMHMEKEHSVRGRLERAPAGHQCVNCPFEDNGKGKLARHIISCAKRFKPDMNLCPPVEWEPPAKIPKIAKQRGNAGYNSGYNRPAAPVRGVSVGNIMSAMATFKTRPRTPAVPALTRAPVTAMPALRGMNNVPVPLQVPGLTTPSGKPARPLQQAPSISITPLPRNPQPGSPLALGTQAKGTFVICEICDGYIKDLEQLRNHMLWTHQVKIHPKMIYNRPPLNCQKCQFRFFTDRGLERHLLGSHGLVTSSMQEAANKGKDAGRCPVCGRVYQWKLLSHVARDHKLTLKPAHLSYKCTVCTATFGMYKQFENHVYSAHRVVAKRVVDKGKPDAPKDAAVLKPVKINDEITITPQPAKATTSKGK
ncbi:MOG interacting and ectopic P-granules protein 1 isoform X2 [Plutella xylostella]|uniref:MOG interacting and ectopic P-granules protein 1 isoform X2 n=1 Tax=Plutella xylostella TaxID=51655 RepID=UPI002032CB78|nr:MOG interacting and ectopic P-granules protein 1 isoform X2 [Plutella xylostella]